MNKTHEDKPMTVPVVKRMKFKLRRSVVKKYEGKEQDE